MTREILFRGKRKDNGEWVYGSYVVTPKGKSRIYYAPFKTATQNTYQEVLPESVGQFIGLLDKNGKKIFGRDILFEDILNTDPGHKKIPDYCVIVSMQYGCFGYEPTHYSKVHPDDQKWQSFYNSDDEELINMNYFEVIGNATDNPELLEDK